VAAGKMVAERTRIPREQQKKALSEASIIIANNKAKTSTPAPEPAPERAPPTENSEKNKLFTTTQWLMIGSIGVSLLGIYYKREELKAQAKAVFGEKKMPEPEPDHAPAPQPKRLRLMD